MHIYLVDGEMLLCMPMEMIIDGPNLKYMYYPPRVTSESMAKRNSLVHYMA